MIQKKHLILLLMGFFLFAFVTESYSQRRSSRSSRSSRDTETREKQEAKSFTESLAYDIYVGTVGFNGGFSAAMKFGAGYKVIDPLTVGVGTKFLYQFQNNLGTNDFSAFNYGYYPYLRFKIAEQFYVKGEYDFYSFDTGQPNADRINFNFPMVGGGYVQGFGKWKFGVELMLMLNDRVIDNPYYSSVEASDLYTLIDYNISFLYNF